MSDHPERRHYPRTKVKLPVVKKAGEDLVDGEIQDLSLGGAFIYFSAMPRLKKVFQMVISAKGRLISITAEIVWSDVQKSNDQTMLTGMGVRFRKVFNNDRRFLLEMIAKHQKNLFLSWLPRN